jgi:hypothetical protein
MNMTFKDLQKTAAGWDLELEPNVDPETGRLVSFTLSTFEDRSVGIFGLHLGAFTPGGFQAYFQNLLEFAADFDQVERKGFAEFLHEASAVTCEILQEGGEQ